MKIREITAKEVKEKYPTLKKLFDAINNRELRSEDQIWVDANYFQDLEELEKANEKVSSCKICKTCQLEEEVFYTDFTALPSYGDNGDDEPSEVVWSWDKENFIVGDEVPFSLIAREPRTKVALLDSVTKIALIKRALQINTV